MTLREQMTKRLFGTGLDLGALHRPMVKHDGMRVLYVDRLPVSELKKHYPELSEYPLVEADIIADAQELLSVESDKYDFVIASHVIEHMSDPLGAMLAWCRVLKKGGQLYLVVPDKRHIFDKKRPLTELDHMREDYNTSPHRRIERDWKHYIEYAELVDGKEGNEIAQHALKLRDTSYSIHFHTFIPESFHSLLIYFMEKVCPCIIEVGPRVALEEKYEFHFLLRKT
jgi:SAM-dependent methyltransferase